MLDNYAEGAVNAILCSHGESLSYSDVYQGAVGATAYKNSSDSGLCFGFGLDENFDTAAKVNNWLIEQNANGTPLTFYYVALNPVETPLTDAEVAEYESLHTNKPVTAILNDGGACMSVSYVADTKAYIDNKFSVLEAAVLSASGNV